MNGKAILGVVVVLGLIVGGLFVYGMLPTQPDKEIGTHPIEFSAIDKLAGEQDAATSAVKIYRNTNGRLELQETITINSAAVSSQLYYTSAEELYLKLYDDSDDSVCTQYLTYTVPYATPSTVYNNKFHQDLFYIDRGDTAVDLSIEYANGTSIADGATLNVTTEGWTSSYAELVLNLRQLTADKGYVNTYNFLRDYKNNHYAYLKSSDTSVSTNILNSLDSFVVGSERYWIIELDDVDLTRDQISTGVYDPDGRFSMDLTIDLTGMSGTDTITFTYGYVYYGDWEHFKSSSSWGMDATTATESVTIDM